jgi:hypothetical protein
MNGRERFSEAMDQLADPEAQSALAHFLAGWFASTGSDEFDRALAAWEASQS